MNANTFPAPMVVELLPPAGDGVHDEAEGRLPR
jgi:hypothetical protein